MVSTSILCIFCALVLIVSPVVKAELGDTYAADLSSKTLPSNGNFVAGPKGASGTITIIEQQKDLFLYEIDLYETGAFTKAQAVYNIPGLPVVLDFPIVFDKNEIVYFGNFTREQLDQQLQTNGYDETALKSDQLYCVITLESPANAAVAGPFTAIEANFTEDVSGTGTSSEDYGETVKSDLIYIAQMDNSTISFYESGFLEGNGTGSVFIQDISNGTYDFSLDTYNIKGPRDFQLRYFANFSSQPVVLNLSTDPKLRTNETSYLGTMEGSDIQAGLKAINAPQNVIDTYFNVSPPVLFLSITDRNNGTIVGFIFNSDAPATQQPIVKAAAATLNTMSAVIVSVLIVAFTVLY